MYWSLLCIKDIIEKKHKIDPQDRYSIVLFSDSYYDQNNFVYTNGDIFKYIYDNIEIVGKTQLPLDVAIKSIINEKRKIGQKIFRIIIISDGFIFPTVTNPIKFAKAASELGIICDAIRYGKGTVQGNILKRVVEITGGTYHYIQSEEEYFDVVKNLAEKKKIKVATILDDHKNESIDKMSQDLALPLLKMDDLTESQKAQINFNELKCAICHSATCLMCETGFYGCGRFCPSCLKPIHLHCAIKWSEMQSKNNDKTENENYKVLRCPFCYYLLRIPIFSLEMTLEKDKGKTSSDINIIEKIKFSENMADLMTSICADPNCGIMFDESSDGFAYKCRACGSYFHIDCLMKSFSQKEKCPYCGCDSKCLDK